MDITQIDDGDATVLVLVGRLDGGTAPQLGTKLDTVVAQRPGVLVLDLDGVDYVSSAGLRVLIVVAKQVREPGIRLALCGLRAHVRELFDISGLAQVFDIFPDRVAARDN
ncbi:MAG: STAS domain-containing protein [Acetobacteraceae bacterium]|nr:STAS domain-containing protein [Acetobacteraceae bacterium]